MTAIDSVLTAAELDRLVEAEAVVAKSLRSVFETGEALRQIQEERLYQGKFDSFEDYCDERWPFGHKRAYRMIQAFQVHSILSPIGDKIELPANEAQARELVPLLAEPDELTAVWTEAVRRGGDRVTAALVRTVRDHLAPTVIDGEGSWSTEDATPDVLISSVSKDTVARQLSQDATVGDRVTGLDGRSRPASAPRAPQDVPAGPDPEIPRQAPSAATTDRPDDTVPLNPRDVEPESPADHRVPVGEEHMHSGSDHPPSGGVPPQNPAAARRPRPAAGGDPRRMVEAAMDRFLEPDPDAAHRDWRNAYMARLVAGHKPIGEVGEFVERADDTCFEELGRLVGEISNFYERVRCAWLARCGDNVIPMRGAR